MEYSNYDTTFTFPIELSSSLLSVSLSIDYLDSPTPAFYDLELTYLGIHKNITRANTVFALVIGV